jgi:eukaryotic-like serine/threonine-protein kinase
VTVVCHQCGSACKGADRYCATCGAALDGESSSQKADPLVGRTIVGAYTLQELVGVGGMGRVYRAEQKVLGRTVAIKVIHPHLLGDEQTVARFYTEARAASRLNHPNSVSIIDFGRTDDGILYLVMEFLQGKDLALVMHEEGPLPFARIADVLVGVLGALAEAHALGVVHRDLKPENIILRRFRSGGDLVKVVDFGLATIVSGVGATSITTPGLVCGTPDYMSPEQGKGENVDGRGDLYSLGVVLYELLTDQLPYNDETPTKVVLRHINDPIPNPVAVAPHRAIPSALAAIALRALQKNASQRYQTAEEMSQAIRRAMTEGDRITADSIICPSCAARNPSSMRFCGSCGARLQPPAMTPTNLTPVRQTFAPATLTMRPLLGRDEEVSRLKGMLAEARDRAIWVHLSGEPGCGKTRLLNEVAHLAEEGGDLVVGAGPHPTRAPVPYGAARDILAALFGVAASELAALAATDEVFSDELVRAGISEAADAQGLVGIEGEGRAGAVAEALATAVRVAAERSRTGRVVIVVDDLPACDGLSQEVLTRLPRLAAKSPVFMITAGYASPANESYASVFELHGIGLDAARKFLGGSSEPGPDSPAFASTRLLLPLYLEQISALGATGADDSLPPRLADAVAQRIDQLDVDARRVMQALSVLGDRTHVETLRSLLDTPGLNGLDALQKRHLVRFSGQVIEIVHPFVRDLVESSIPAEARRALHERAFQLAADRSEALEVRAEHAYRMGEPLSALVILERMGDRALVRGDARAAVLAFRRALELGRREMLETGDLMLETAILTFSRKLGEGLERSGDAAGADGVLREALDLAGPASSERARMLVSLARIAVTRDRPRDAHRLLGQALELVTRTEDREGEAGVQRGLARLRRNDGDAKGAANALRRTAELEATLRSAYSRRTATLIELAELLAETGESESAERVLVEAKQNADSAGSAALQARILGVTATIELARPNRAQAASTFREAARLASQAGDVRSRDRFREAASQLS